ncbi:MULTISPECIES: acyl-CoA dehydrogenase family protein [Brevibacterium]|uniref:Acyl-CoA dehydrogenase n=2 Tax=Brevibacterium casei TaxID=33889 RepID=A0A161S9L4_9MICO|nr:MULTISPECIES: acyl-CoA dehydrogenase family protein [Brevibacterium]NJE65426.1 acyl-CoA dehydrogenase [Brevibacterium sp. LS14]SIG96960.1 acyl-CoA dehydrogenase [Mycobacteroides abscessus subsp. abscessus]KZE22786.1 acyl-CoA dehydrogenase [Brevibacterium casei]MBE4695335.1 acyl-CoA dehydrogenase [Brevibacterium casei]MBY3578457.1 acyl-CoA dehydrogenase [Brevibacterium casei]
MSYTPWPLSDEQRDVIDLCRSFAAEEIRPAARAVDEADTESPVGIFRAAAKVGITDFMIPEEYGGGGFTDVFTQCLVQEQLCFGDPGIGNFVCSNGFFADPILALGTPEQKEAWLRPLTGDDPKFTALATTEPGSGSDSASIITRADRADGGYVLNGQKAWISNAGLADFYVVFAKTDPAQRSRGVTAFLLEKDTPGMEFGAPMKKMGQRAIVCREIFLSDAFVPEANRLGGEGEGFYGLMRTFDISRVVLGAAALGTARAAYEYARDYARERTQFGKAIIDHQAVAFRLADMSARIDAAWLQVLNAARMIDAGSAVPRQRVTASAAMAKLNASETAMFCTWAAVQTLGGWGYSREHPVEQWMRDAKLEEIEEGTSDIMRVLISRNLV